jgi:hypothetical protein
MFLILFRDNDIMLFISSWETERLRHRPKRAYTARPRAALSALEGLARRREIRREWIQKLATRLGSRRGA